MLVPQVWCVCGHLVMCGGEGVRVCRVTGVDGVSLATVLGQKTTPSQKAILVTTDWVHPRQVWCYVVCDVSLMSHDLAGTF